MTAPDQPCSDGTRRHLFRLMREHNVPDHHAVLPWCGITSLSREGGVTEGQVLQLIRWVQAGCPRSVHRHLAPDQHRVVTYLEGGDVEFETMTEEEYAMATTPRVGRVRVPPRPEPAPIVDVEPTTAPPVVPVATPVPEPSSTGRPMVGRIRLGAKPSPPPEPEPEPVVDLATSRFVWPCPEPESEWRHARVGREPHGPPCPLDLHPVGDLGFYARGMRA